MARPRNYMPSQAHVGLQMTNADELIKQLEELEFAVREKVAREAIAAAQVPLQAAVLALTPESHGSRDKQSEETKKKWSGAKKLKTTIRSVVRVRKRAGITAGVLGLVGPSYSDGGGHGNLFSKDHERTVYWGKDMGRERKVNQFVKRAADQSRAQVQAVLTAAVKSGIDQAVRATNG